MLRIAYVFNALAEVPWRGLLKRTPLSRQKQSVVLSRPLACLRHAVLLAFDRQEYYVCPSGAAAAGTDDRAWLAEEERESKNKTGLDRRRMAGPRIPIVFVILGACGAGPSFFFAWHGQPPAAGADLASLLSQNPDDYVLSLGHFLDLERPGDGLLPGPPGAYRNCASRRQRRQLPLSISSGTSSGLRTAALPRPPLSFWWRLIWRW